MLENEFNNKKGENDVCKSFSFSERLSNCSTNGTSEGAFEIVKQTVETLFVSENRQTGTKTKIISF